MTHANCTTESVTLGSIAKKDAHKQNRPLNIGMPNSKNRIRKVFYCSSQ